MKNSVSFRRVMLVSSVHLAALLLGPVALAQSVLPVELGPEIEQREGIPSSDFVAITFEGFVGAPDGTAAEGAVVVSSAGGQAVTDALGSFRFEADLPLDATSVRITAVGRAGQNLLASEDVSLPAASAHVWVGQLQLARGSTCHPGWLPTFGGEPGMSSSVSSLTVFDDGDGPAFYAAGGFFSAGGVSATKIAKWDGVGWTRLGRGLNNSVLSLAVFDDGGGEALYVGGFFSTAGGQPANRIAKWDGMSWAALGGGLSSLPGSGNGVLALAVFDDGGGEALYAGGEFTLAGDDVVNRIAKWDGSAWSALGSGVSNSGGSVRALTVFDDGGGACLYAGGRFTIVGGVAANRIAKWDGTSWSALGSGTDDSVETLIVFDDGGGEALYVGGHFTTAGSVIASDIAKWDGSSWSALGSGIAGPLAFLDALTVFDDGGGAALYVGGRFTTAGSVLATNIAKWDGTSWSALGGGVGGGAPEIIDVLAVFDDGDGAALYSGGFFGTAGGVVAKNIAKWDNSSWSPLGNGMDASVRALTSFDDGGGAALYAGGSFTTGSGVVVSRIAKWDGASWVALSSGIGIGGSVVYALTVFDDGAGDALFAGGRFTTAGGVTANSIAKWDGTNWSALDSGMDDTVLCPDGSR